MKKNGKRLLVVGSILVVAFAIWTVLIQLVDVQAIGPKGTEVGFATLNSWFHKWTGVHMSIYVITDWLGLIPIFVCVIFAGFGLAQFVQRKSLCKVDYDMICLGIYYVFVVVAYLVFEMIPINYRPILIEGNLETSYPSSTTLLVLSVMPTLIFQVKRRVQNVVARKMICILTSIFSTFMVVGRTVSGVHWITDIVGSMMLSVGLFCIYKALVLLYYRKEQ